MIFAPDTSQLGLISRLAQNSVLMRAIGVHHVKIPLTAALGEARGLADLVGPVAALGEIAEPRVALDNAIDRPSGDRRQLAVRNPADDAVAVGRAYRVNGLSL